ncbi:MAG: hypothetical protein WAT09_07700 [Paracoccaceae bacterium]
MSLLTSAPNGLGLLGWRRIALTALAFCLAPAVAGLLILVILQVFGPTALGPDPLRNEGMATFALVSPLIVAPVWAMIGLGAAWLLKRGWFGWLSSAALGLLAFAVLARTEIGLISLPFGVVSGVLFRMALALQRPLAI